MREKIEMVQSCFKKRRDSKIGKVNINKRGEKMKHKNRLLDVSNVKLSGASEEVVGDWVK